MKPAASTGDVVLAAEPATREAFAPYGRLLRAGARRRMGRGGGVLLAVDPGRPGPRRFGHFQRYAEAARAVIALEPVPLLLVVAAPAEGGAAPPAAFRVPPGQGVLLTPGIWHAGPVAMEATTLLEIIETQGPADRFDRLPVSDLLGADAIRVALPEDPEAPRSGLDLHAPGAVMMDPSLEGRLRLGLLLLDDLDVANTETAGPPPEAAEVTRALRAMWGSSRDLAEVPGVGEARSFWRTMGLDPARTPPPGEALLRQVLSGRDPRLGDSLADALALCTLRLQVAVVALDAGAVAGPLIVRRGTRGEAYAAPGGRRVGIAGRPAIFDREGPMGGPLEPAARVRPGSRTRRALVVVWLPAQAGAVEAGARLDEVERTVREACGGRSVARLVLPAAESDTTRPLS